jgi:mannitol/fructose-specific phosphotransferase system IIA component (Ntr-type)
MRDNVTARCVAGNQSLRFAPVTIGASISVQLREFFAEDAINLNLQSTTKDGVLKELVGLLKLDDKSDAMLFKMLKRRETLGSTGIGQSIAIPHCRSLVVSRLRVAFGRRLEGVDFDAIDGKPVHYFFLIVAPPLEVSNQYLPVLGKIAQFAKEPDVPEKLAKLQSPQEFLRLLEEKHI